MKIGSITLDNDLVWTDEFQFTEGVGMAERTIYGNMIVQTRQIYGGRPLTLVGTQTNGWQSRDIVIALQALIKADPAASHIVELPDGRTFTAIFRNEEAPAIEFTPITLATAPTGDFWYYGSLKMRIIT